MKFNLILATVILLITANVYGASHVTISRNWQEQSQNLTATMTVPVQETHYDQQGNPHTTTTTRWVYVHVRILNEAKLRTGEREYFAVSAYASGNGPSTSIHIHVNPELVYHAYNTGFGTTFGNGTHVYINMQHNGRIKNVPPLSLDEAQVTFTTVSEPVTLAFRDFGISENQETTTVYNFEIKRSLTLFPDKLVAHGSFSGNSSPEQSITITKDSPFCSDGTEYFKSGKKYVVRLSLQRKQSIYYTQGMSPEGKFTFKWEKSGRLLLKAIRDKDIETASQKQRDNFEKTYKNK